MEPVRQTPPHPGAGSSNLADRTPTTPSTFIPSALSSVSTRHNYESLPAEEEDTSYKGAHGSTRSPEGDESVHGLRIQFPDHEADKMAFGATVENGSSPEVPGSSRELLSPHSARSRHYGFPSPGGTLYPDDDRSTTYGGRSSPNSLYSPFTYNGDNESTRKLRASTIGSLDPRKALDELQCKTRRQIQTSRRSWLSITILTLSLYSTVFSAMWLGLAVTKPRYHKHITNSGPLTPPTASLLCAAFAKTIELSFVTIFVTALGQALSHTAIRQNSKGITVADMLLRQWIQQPGSLITHWETLRYSALTLLGTLTLTATLISMLYTTASDALVAPKLKFGGNDKKMLWGEVKTIFGNESYQVSRCKTPAGDQDTPWDAGATCMEIEHSGQAYHNYMQFLPMWDDFSKTHPGSTEMSKRPAPVAMLWDNTTVWGKWIQETNMPEASAQYDRVVNNVTLAMPLTAVVGAARLKKNSILQPQDFNGLGEYYVHASVPSPSINVLCAGLTNEELKPLVYTEWPDYNGTKPNATNWPAQYDADIPRLPSYINKTAVDDLFGWGEKYNRRHPVFPRIPRTFKTVMNSTNDLVDGLYTDSIYILATSNVTNSSQICSIRATIYPHCSTEYHASMSGGNLTAHCDIEGNDLAYSQSHPDATVGVRNHNWTQVANRWVTTMSLGAGITDDPASNARLLTQLIPLKRELDPKKPSIAEALAVEAGCTVILSALDTPFIHHYNYTDLINFPLEPVLQQFNATIRSQEYSSGGTQPWQGIFYLVLIGTLLLNVACLLYFIITQGLITDYMEPHNLFALAINSPASKALEGSCGGGPEGGELGSRWHVDIVREREHFYIHSLDEKSTPRIKERKGHVNRESGWETEMHGVVGDREGGRSPAGEQFERLSKKPSSLF